jgi:hypothetical protein
MPCDPNASRLWAGAVALAVATAPACYHYTFDQVATPPAPPASAPGPMVRHQARVPTYINGFVGNGTVDTRVYCDAPVRTELRVTAADVLLSVVTLLIYTPHTLYVTCPAAEDRVTPRPTASQ